VIPATINAIDETHIQSLADSERAEDRYIDFELNWIQDHPWEGRAANVCAGRKLLAFLALMAMSSAGIADDCPISDWPLDLPQGEAAMVQVLRSAATVVTRVVPARVSSGAAQQRSMAMAPTAPANPHPNPPRDWRGSRAAAPTDQQRLMYAVMDGDVAAVKKYMKSPQVHVNAPLNSNTRLGLLDFAVQGALPDVARALIDGGAHVRSEPGDDIDVYPVYTAVSSLNTYLHMRDRPDPFFNRPPLSTEHFVDAIRLLLEAGADPNSSNAKVDSPLGELMFAPRFEGDVALVRLLVAHGARASGSGAQRAPLSLAVDYGYDDYVAAMVGSADSAALDPALTQAVYKGYDSMALALLAAGANPNAADAPNPLLCFAIGHRQPPALLLAMLAHGANVNADCGRNGRTPLSLVDKDDHSFIDMLLDRGAHLGVAAEELAEYESHGLHVGPIFWSVSHQEDYLASKLVARDSAAAKKECGLVVYAARYGASLTLQQLLKLGADPNSTSQAGSSALMAAAFHGQTPALQVLLAQPRIEVNQTTPRHFNVGYFRIQLEGKGPPLISGARTALMFAAMSGSGDATAALLAHGAKLHQTDAEGQEAAQYARGEAVLQVLKAERPH
jgi:ankyrin repeat protein